MRSRRARGHAPSAPSRGAGFAWPERPKLESLFHFAWPVSLAVGLTWIQSQGYRFVIESKLGAEQVGFFVAGYVVSSGIMTSFEAVMHAYFLPSFYSNVSKGEAAQSSAWNDYAAAVFPAYLLTAAFMAAFAAPLSVILLGPKFHDVAIFTAIAALTEAARAISGAYALIAHAKMRTQLLVLPAGLGAILALALVPLMTNQFGLVGTGWALALSGWAVVVFMHVRMTHLVSIDLPFSRMGVAIIGGAVLALVAYWAGIPTWIPSVLGNAVLVVGLALSNLLQAVSEL
ncbi:MAG: oligosaccharide flippase family protein, partial [Bdellovibrionota bacterium]